MKVNKMEQESYEGTEKTSLKTVIVAFAAGIILSIIFVATAEIVHASETVKIYPSDDVYTDSSQPTRNFNNSNLRVGYDANYGKHRSYLKFDTSSLQGKTVTSAKFSIDPLFPFGTPVQLFHITNDNWKENTVTWSSASSLSYNSTPVDSKTIPNGDRVEFNVLPIINDPDRKVSILLMSSQESTKNLYTQFFSKDMDDNLYKPYIEVTYDGSQQCNTAADTDCNGCVSLTEMISSIVKFKTGQSTLTLSQIISIIVQFKTGGISC